MMGKTFPTPATTSNTTAAVKKSPPTATATATTAGKTAAQRKKIHEAKAATIVSPTLPNTPVSPVAPLTPLSIAAPRTPVKREADDDDNEDLCVVSSSNHCGPDTTVARPMMQLSAAPAEMGVPGELTLTLQIPPSQGSPFGHLNPEARFYMQYFEDRVARDFVLFDRVSDNPYRHLMPAAAHHPALLNGILAVAARHHSNLTNTSVAKHLPYKGLSFAHLSQDLQRLGTKGILTEPTLAVVMLFIFFETLDGGLNTWKIHLRGARRLIQECLALDSLPENTSAMLRIFMNHVTLVDIIGRTLAFSATSQPSVFDQDIPEFLAVLREGEAHNFLGCPAELLETIHAVTLLKPRARTHPPSDACDFLSTARALLARIDSFSAATYVAARTDIDAADSPALSHLVHAYRCAARVYAVETLFPLVTTRDAIAPYHAELRRHIAALQDRSLFLKGAVWPVFVAGTGAHSTEERAWTRTQLGRLWEVLPQGNIKNAGIVLEDIWERGDAGGERGWTLLEKGGRDWLFV
ncbi:fungal-specific transcription factor domain-containing protein [Tricharina praecox]|uniref:fungal-specific transcription factor domain-containing protein n=1 Tax=Tricharina praecox TaxID=43433 RepID=UPI0022203D3C|nr:fungal-specific transcription factor domain-containing protein [Tricharina praecox]KAI5841696.1 fungal-specific transcription factor domain-containing protein [Tricharina praecox]